MRTLVWLQRELRTQHHSALETALATSDEVIVVYFHDPKQTLGDANSAWLARSLQQLQQDFQSRKGQLWLIEGDFSTQFKSVLLNHKIDQVYYTFQLGAPFSNWQQQALQVCQALKIPLRPFDTENWLPYNQILNGSGLPYKVFTPFYKSLMSKISLLEPFNAPVEDLQKTRSVNCPDHFQSLPKALQDLSNQSWANKILQHWQVGEAQAWLKLDDFVASGIENYDVDRDLPAKHGTSQLSAHLHFGEIHSRAILFALAPLESPRGQIIHIWLRQLAWREFARSILWHFPTSEQAPFQSKFANFYTELNDFDEQQDKIYQAWCQGRTGIPIIDAGMKQLWETGWMHNRVRMLVASWLTKNANIDWRLGVDWFNNTLVDADPANNILGWQWVAGCGVDAAPYYRLFNPIRQSEKFDAQGDYLRHWLPPLAKYTAKQIHMPSNVPDYPKPIIDLTLSRQAHLARRQHLKASSSTEKSALDECITIV